jgi:hypothetical protein
MTPTKVKWNKILLGTLVLASLVFTINFIVKTDIFEKNEELIPKRIHFVILSKDGNTKKLSLSSFVAIKAAKMIYADWQIWVHHDGKIAGENWDRAKQFIDKLVQVSPPDTISGKNIQIVQHKSDWIRLNILREYGGVYLDTDVIAIRPIPPVLRKSNTVLAREKNNDRICNAIIMAKPNSIFINDWIEGYITGYNPNSWSYNSMEYPTLMGKLYTGEVNIQDRQLFFYGYEDIHTRNLNIDHHFFLHFWYTASVDNWKSSEGIENWTREDLVRKNSTFSNIMLRYLDWKEERDGPKYRRQWSYEEVVDAERRNPW